MSECRLTVAAEDGLQSRSATLFVQVASHADSMVTVAKDGGDPVSAKSFLSVEALEVCQGDRITLCSSDEGTLEKLADVVSSD